MLQDAKSLSRRKINLYGRMQEGKLREKITMLIYSLWVWQKVLRTISPMGLKSLLSLFNNFYTPAKSSC